MRLSPAAAEEFLDRPDERIAGALLWGGDGAAVSAARDRLRRALLGAEGDGGLRETRIGAVEARRAPALVLDAMKSTGFFGGRPVVVVDAATDAATDALDAALATWRAGDGFLLVSAGALPARSRLRKVFEGSGSAVSVAIRAQATDRRALAALAREAGCEADGEALDRLEGLAAELDAAALADLARRAALHARAEGAGVIRAVDLEVCAPLALGGDADRIADDVLLGRKEGLTERLRRIEARGIAAGTIASATGRRLRALHGRIAGGGGDRPQFGAAAEVFEAAQRAWNIGRVEGALAEIHNLERRLRASPRVSPYALLERALIRIAASARSAGRG